MLKKVLLKATEVVGDCGLPPLLKGANALPTLHHAFAVKQGLHEISNAAQGKPESDLIEDPEITRGIRDRAGNILLSRGFQNRVPDAAILRSRTPQAMAPHHQPPRIVEVGAA